MPTLGTEIIKNFKSEDPFKRKMSQWMWRLGVFAILISILSIIFSIFSKLF